MASELQLVVDLDDRASQLTWWAQSLELLDHLESRWSRFLPDSDVSRLNLACGRLTHVDPSTITLLTAMIDGWHATERRFDPTTLRALLDAGYRSSIDDRNRVTVLPSGFVRVDDPRGEHGDPTLDDIEIDPDARTVRLPAGLAIDPGGIGKGLAADLAVAHLLRSGAAGAMINVGGDIAMSGRAPDHSWTIQVEHPDPNCGILASLSVNGGGVATSSTRSRRWRHDGSDHHHIIDPWTGAPSTTDLTTATVIARSGWLAEAHATAAILAGSAHVIDYLDRHELSGLAVTADNRVLATDDLSDLRHEGANTPMMGASR